MNRKRQHSPCGNDKVVNPSPKKKRRIGSIPTEEDTPTENKVNPDYVSVSSSSSSEEESDTNSSSSSSEESDTNSSSSSSEESDSEDSNDESDDDSISYYVELSMLCEHTETKERKEFSGIFGFRSKQNYEDATNSDFLELDLNYWIENIYGKEEEWVIVGNITIKKELSESEAINPVIFDQF
jgi:hypothetical protein